MLTTAIITEQQGLNLITLINTPAEAINNLLRLDANKSYCSFDQQECKSILHNDMGIQV